MTCEIRQNKKLGMKKSLTPVMKQYWEVKSAHPDKIVLFQMGDFYEMFYKDAEIAAPLLNLALTSRNKKAEDAIPMCGVPLHSMSKIAGQLLTQGYKVVVCDQVEDQFEKKGLVQRKVKRILSPGIAYDPSILDELKAHYICAFDEQTVSFADSTTGEAFYYPVSRKEELTRLLLLLQPVEIIFDEKQRDLIPSKLDRVHLTLDPSPPLPSSLDMPLSVYRLKAYMKKMMGDDLKSLRAFKKRYVEKDLLVSPVILRHLEIIHTFDGQSKGSLFSAVNRTKTFAGARLLKQNLISPLAEKEIIEKRLDRVEFFVRNVSLCNKVRQSLAGAGDLERRIGKVGSPSVNGRDLLALGQSIIASLKLLELDKPSQAGFQSYFQNLHDLGEGFIRDIQSSAPVSVKEGKIFNRGVNSELDSLIQWSENASKKVIQLEEKERQSSGIPSLKIRYNQVFGYYIEVTKLHTHKVPSRYLRKQTLVQAERYTTSELQNLEQKVLTARSKRISKEYEIFKDKIQQASRLFPELHQLARWTAELDVSSSLAFLALERNYTRPVFSDSLHLINSRHPVIEQERPFTANTLSMKQGECLLLTGPNMAGKSTLMRQTALNILLAQSGSFISADASSRLPLFKKMFTRIGSSDLLHSGLSTFMVEMTEVSEIIRGADEHSFIVLDELGRGTSTYDGMSLAQAILEYMIEKNKSYILFSTHYHELTRLKSRKVKHGYMAVQELKNTIDFLYTLREGSCQRSYGIDVGEKALLPEEVIQRARELVAQFEGKSLYNEREEAPMQNSLPFDA